MLDSYGHLVKPIEIGSAAFRNCRDLETVTLPRDCTTIGDGAFYGCDKLSFLYYDGSFDFIKHTGAG